jgi:Arc/MetJ family transcription regulator
MNVLQKLVEELKEAKAAAKLTNAGFGFPNDRIEIKSMHIIGKDVKEGDVVHPDVYIKEMVKLHHETWVVGPIDRAIGILNLHAEVIQRSEELLQGLENLGLEQLLDLVEAGRKSR